MWEGILVDLGVLRKSAERQVCLESIVAIHARGTRRDYTEEGGTKHLD